jgi:serine/threonine protein phosphatase PrpC
VIVIVVLIVGDMCYCANVGDSRAVLSSDSGEVIVPLSRDHKPCEVNEYQRKLYNHKLVTKIIETECGKSLKDVIQYLIDSGKINVEMNEPDFYNPYD